MPTAPTVARPSPRAPSRTIGTSLAVLAALVIAAVLFVITSSSLSGPGRVDVSVTNPTGYEVTVTVRDAAGGSTHRLGPVAADATREFTSVVDQGETWLFEFSYGGIDAGELTIDRDRLDDGPVTVPDDVATTLEEAGLPPSSG